MPSQPLQLYQGNNRTEKKVLLLFSCWTSLCGTGQGRRFCYCSAVEPHCVEQDREEGSAIVQLLNLIVWNRTGKKVLLLFSCWTSLCGTGQGRRFCYCSAVEPHCVEQDREEGSAIVQLLNLTVWNRTGKKVLLLFSCWTSLCGTGQGRRFCYCSAVEPHCVEQDREEGTAIVQLLNLIVWNRTGKKVLLLFSCWTSLCGTGQGRRFCYCSAVEPHCVEQDREEGSAIVQLLNLIVWNRTGKKVLLLFSCWTSLCGTGQGRRFCYCSAVEPHCVEQDREEGSAIVQLLNLIVWNRTGKKVLLLFSCWTSLCGTGQGRRFCYCSAVEPHCVEQDREEGSAIVQLLNLIVWNRTGKKVLLLFSCWTSLCGTGQGRRFCYCSAVEPHCVEQDREEGSAIVQLLNLIVWNRTGKKVLLLFSCWTSLCGTGQGRRFCYCSAVEPHCVEQDREEGSAIVQLLNLIVWNRTGKKVLLLFSCWTSLCGTGQGRRFCYCSAVEPHCVEQDREEGSAIVQLLNLTVWNRTGKKVLLLFSCWTSLCGTGQGRRFCYCSAVEPHCVEQDREEGSAIVQLLNLIVWNRTGKKVLLLFSCWTSLCGTGQGRRFCYCSAVEPHCVEQDREEGSAIVQLLNLIVWNRTGKKVLLLFSCWTSLCGTGQGRRFCYCSAVEPHCVEQDREEGSAIVQLLNLIVWNRTGKKVLLLFSCWTSLCGTGQGRRFCYCSAVEPHCVEQDREEGSAIVQLLNLTVWNRTGKKVLLLFSCWTSLCGTGQGRRFCYCSAVEPHCVEQDREEGSAIVQLLNLIVWNRTGKKVLLLFSCWTSLCGTGQGRRFCYCSAVEPHCVEQDREEGSAIVQLLNLIVWNRTGKKVLLLFSCWTSLCGTGQGRRFCYCSAVEPHCVEQDREEGSAIVQLLNLIVWNRTGKKVLLLFSCWTSLCGTGQGRRFCYCSAVEPHCVEQDREEGSAIVQLLNLIVWNRTGKKVLLLFSCWTSLCGTGQGRRFCYCSAVEPHCVEQDREEGSAIVQLLNLIVWNRTGKKVLLLFSCWTSLCGTGQGRRFCYCSAVEPHCVEQDREEGSAIVQLLNLIVWNRTGKKVLLLFSCWTSLCGTGQGRRFCYCSAVEPHCVEQDREEGSAIVQLLNLIVWNRTGKKVLLLFSCWTSLCGTGQGRRFCYCSAVEPHCVEQDREEGSAIVQLLNLIVWNRTGKKVLLLFSCWTSLCGTGQGRRFCYCSAVEPHCVEQDREEGSAIVQLLNLIVWNRTGKKVLLLFSCWTSLCGTGQGRRFCYEWRHVMPQGSRWKTMSLCHPWSISSQPLCMCMWVESQTTNRWADTFFVIIMDICNAPTPQLWGRLTSITHIMYIEMENVISNLTKH